MFGPLENLRAVRQKDAHGIIIGRGCRSLGSPAELEATSNGRVDSACEPIDFLISLKYREEDPESRSFVPTQVSISIDNQIDPAREGQALEELKEALSETPRRIPTRFLYDQHGSQLFERITQLDEYYLTRAERFLLERHSEEIQQLTECEELVELGSGAATKTRLLLDAMQAAGRLGLYIPFDVSESEVQRVAEELVREYPGLRVHGIVADFLHHLTAIPEGGNRLVLLLGSTIGNFDREAAVGFLRRLATQMESGDYFLLGIDLIKDEKTIEAAYNDRLGITAEFNRNILRVVNNLAQADFDVDGFDHRAIYNRDLKRMELNLIARRRMSVSISAIDLTLEIDSGEALNTEISSKYDQTMVETMLGEAGFRPVQWFPHPQGLFALTLTRI